MTMTVGRLRAIAIAGLAICCLASPVEAGCTVSTIGVAFGRYDVFSPTDMASTGIITLDCKKADKNVSVHLSTGSSGTYVSRTLRGPGPEVLNYNIFIDGPSGPIWGNGTGGTRVYANPKPGNAVVTLTMYGRITARQDVRAGDYADTVVVEVNF